jgi:hypothetical protein
MSLSIVLIQKSGEVSTLSIKAFNVAEIYKKCGYKTDTDFGIQAEYTVQQNDQTIQYVVYGKPTGRAGNENKYEFPPLKGTDIDSRLLFGTCAIIAINQTLNQYAHLTVEGWESVYEQLHGGFDDLDDDQSRDSSDDDAETLDSELSEESYIDDEYD